MASPALGRLRAIGPDDRIAIVDHLDELRLRIIVSLAALGAAFAFSIWQNRQLLEVVNQPLGGKQPLTLGVTEPFMTTIMVAGYAALLLALPVILWQLYAFVLPAFSQTERRVALPLLLLIPVLFLVGAAFAFLIVIPAALQFLLQFNADEFQTEIRAREYYGFVTQTVLAVGLVFQVPVGILVLSRLGIVTPELLRKNRRFAIVGCAVLAMLLPGVDPVTMLIETVPLLVLYEISILLAAAFGRPR